MKNKRVNGEYIKINLTNYYIHFRNYIYFDCFIAVLLIVSHNHFCLSSDESHVKNIKDLLFMSAVIQIVLLLFVSSSI